MATFRRRSFVRRRRPRHWLWVRSNQNSVAGVANASFAQNDLLNVYRTTAGIDINLPEFTIWRLRIRISVHVTVKPVVSYTSADGVLVAVFCDDFGDPGTNPVTSPYDERYMLWDTMYVSEALMTGVNGGSLTDATNGILMEKQYDIKAHRRLGNLKDSCLLQIAPTGSALAITDFSFTQSMLLLLRN